MNRIAIFARLLLLLGAVLLNAVVTAKASQSLPRADAVLAGAPQATWIAEGEGRRVIYVFFDPNCPSCQLLYRNLWSAGSKLDIVSRSQFEHEPAG